MKKFLVITFILIFTLFNFKSVSSTEVNNNKLYPIEINESWGFINAKGKVVVEPKFKKVEEITDGYYIAAIDDWKSGAIGSYVITPKSTVIRICDEYSDVILSNNKKYAIVSEVLTDGCVISSNKLIVNLDTGSVVYDKSYEDEEYELLTVIGNCYVLKNYEGLTVKNFRNKVLAKEYDFCLNEEYYDEDYELIDTNEYLLMKKDNILHWFDENGNKIFKYEDERQALSFYKGVVALIDEDRKLRFMDRNKKILNTYIDCYDIFRKDNLYFAEFKDENIILNGNGNKILSFKKDDINYMSQGNHLICDKKISKLNAYDENGNHLASYDLPQNINNEKTLPELVDDNIILKTKTGFGICKINNKKTEWILKPKYSNIQIKDSMAIAYLEDKATLFNFSTQKIVLENYSKIQIYDKDMIYVNTTQLNGYVDSTGKFVYVQAK